MSYRYAPRLAWQLIDGEAVVVDLDRPRTLGLNRVASLIWSFLPERDEATIAAEMARRFDVSLETATSDVSEFLRSLRAQGLVVEA